MITPAYSTTATERVLPVLALDFTTGVLDSRVTIVRALDTATRTNSSGALEVVNANLPRFDYNPTTLAPNGLLIEELRANLFLNSTINGASLATQTVAVTAVAHTISFYGTGTITLSGAATATVVGTGVYPNRQTLTFTPIVGALICTVTGSVQYAQLEVGTFATSYIPTAATSVARNADVVSMTGTNFSSWYNASEGTFVVSGYSVASLVPANTLIYATDGTETNYIRMLGNSVSSSGVVSLGVPQATFSLGTPNINSALNDYVIAYKVNSFYAARNSSSGSDTSGTLPVIDRLLIGSRSSGAVMSGTIKRIYFYTIRLIDNEVLTLSVRSVKGA
jgi:hypothetical protein